MKKVLLIICLVFVLIVVYQLAVYFMSISKQDKVRVEPFLAFGNDKEVFFKGRVIKAYTQRRPSSKNNWLENIMSSIKRYSGSSVPNAKVEIIFQEKSYSVSTDEDGVFELHILDSQPSLQSDEIVTFKVLEPTIRETPIAHREVRRYAGQTGIISDIDDTIIISHSTEIGKKFWLSISKNAYTRRPLPGVSGFYKKLTENGKLPIFYVSSSDWSLFDLINDFLRFRDLPEGPILLKDKHINLRNVWKSGQGDHTHKLDKIALIMEMFPEMQFYLIGDSGQHDPELYAEIIQKYPERIKDVYIRLVGELGEERRAKIESLADFEHFHFIKTSEEAIKIAEQETIIQ